MAQRLVDTLAEPTGEPAQHKDRYRADVHGADRDARPTARRSRRPSTRSREAPDDLLGGAGGEPGAAAADGRAARSTKTAPSRRRRRPRRRRGALMARGLWSGTLSFGLVAVPVEHGQRGARPRRALPRGRRRDGERDRDPAACARATARRCPWEEIGHGYELDGRLVVLVRRGARGRRARAHAHDRDRGVRRRSTQIDPAHFDHPYYLLPQARSRRASRAPTGCCATRWPSTGQVAIGRIVLRSKRVAGGGARARRPALAHDDAVRERDPRPESDRRDPVRRRGSAEKRRGRRGAEA